MDADARSALFAAAATTFRRIIKGAYFVNAVDRVIVCIMTARALIGARGAVPAETRNRGDLSSRPGASGQRGRHPDSRRQLGLWVDGDGGAGLFEKTPAGRVEPLHQGFVFGVRQETQVKVRVSRSNDIGGKGLCKEIFAYHGLIVVGHVGENHDVLAVICTCCESDPKDPLFNFFGGPF